MSDRFPNSAAGASPRVQVRVIERPPVGAPSLLDMVLQETNDRPGRELLDRVLRRTELAEQARRFAARNPWSGLRPRVAPPLSPRAALTEALAYGAQALWEALRQNRLVPSEEEIAEELLRRMGFDVSRETLKRDEASGLTIVDMGTPGFSAGDGWVQTYAGTDNYFPATGYSGSSLFSYPMTSYAYWQYISFAPADEPPALGGPGTNIAYGYAQLNYSGGWRAWVSEVWENAAGTGTPIGIDVEAPQPLVLPMPAGGLPIIAPKHNIKQALEKHRVAKQLHQMLGLRPTTTPFATNAVPPADGLEPEFEPASRPAPVIKTQPELEAPYKWRYARRQPEKKLRVKNYHRWMVVRILEGLTEGCDAVGAVYKALPTEVQKYERNRYALAQLAKGERPKKKLPCHLQAQAILDNWRLLSAEGVVRELLWEAMEDAIIGRSGQIGANATGNLMRRTAPDGQTFGGENVHGRDDSEVPAPMRPGLRKQEMEQLEAWVTGRETRMVDPEVQRTFEIARKRDTRQAYLRQRMHRDLASTRGYGDE